MKNTWNWIVDTVAGGTIGATCGAIVAINIDIWFGPDQGYQSSFGDVFEHNVATGIAATMALIAGSVLGILGARRWRHSRSDR